MNILVCGLLWSGSSALVDMLKEYSDVGLIQGELDELRRPGMISDHIDGLISDVYPSQVEIFLKAQYKPGRKLLKNFLNGHLYNLKRWRALKEHSRIITSSASREEKLAAARKYTGAIKDIYAEGKSHAVFDQPIIISQHLDVWPKVFSPFKMFFIYRDPRDQLAQIIKQNHLFLYFCAPEQDIYGGGRLGAIKYQIHTLKTRIKWMEKIIVTQPENAVALSFERLVRDNEFIRAKVELFSGLLSDSNNEKVLDPKISEKNIGIYKSYLSDDELELIDELYKDYLIREQKNRFYQ